MSEEGQCNCGEPMFPLDLAEALSIYSMLFEQNTRFPSDAEVMDEIERRELFPGKRDVIPKSLEMRRELIADLRDFLVQVVGPDQVAALEQSLLKMIAERRGVTPT